MDSQENNSKIGSERNSDGTSQHSIINSQSQSQRESQKQPDVDIVQRDTIPRYTTATDAKSIFSSMIQSPDTIAEFINYELMGYGAAIIPMGSDTQSSNSHSRSFKISTKKWYLTKEKY